MVLLARYVPLQTLNHREEGADDPRKDMPSYFIHHERLPGRVHPYRVSVAEANGDITLTPEASIIILPV